MEISPTWIGTEICQIISDFKLIVMLSAGGWWFETTKLSPSSLSPRHRCLTEYMTDQEILQELKDWTKACV